MEDKAMMKKLCEIAHDMRRKAYCPYSNYQVGAALLGKSGMIYKGCNVENASYGLSICAERTAMVRAVSDGERRFRMLAVSAGDNERFLFPCGACRQFLVEFGEFPVIAVKPNGDTQVLTTKQLLPESFGPSDLDLEEDPVAGGASPKKHKITT